MVWWFLFHFKDVNDLLSDYLRQSPSFQSFGQKVEGMFGRSGNATPTAATTPTEFAPKDKMT